MGTKAFWRAASERAGKTFVQVMLPYLGLTALISPDWGDLTNAAGLAAISAGMSLLTSMASTLRGDPQSPSLLKPPPS